jgi:hypothetical protein
VEQQNKPQAMPQPPQLALFVRAVPGMHGNGKHAPPVSVHAPLQQLCVPPPQSESLLHLHWPLLHTRPVAHFFEQAPQLVAAVSEASQPSLGLSLQSS